MDLKNQPISQYLKKPVPKSQNHIPRKKQNWLLSLLTKQNIELLIQTVSKKELSKYLILSFILIEIVLVGIITNVIWIVQLIIFILN